MTEHQSSLPNSDMPGSKPDDGSDSYRVGSTLFQADPSKRADSCKTSLRNCRRWNCGRLACSHSRFTLVSKSTNPLKASDALHAIAVIAAVFQDAVIKMVNPRLCRGDSQSLTIPGILSAGDMAECDLERRRQILTGDWEGKRILLPFIRQG